METTERIITKEMFVRIMNKRLSIPRTAHGERVNFVIDSNGNDIDVTDSDGEPVESATEPGTVLRKRIYNLNANSELAMANPLNKALLAAAIKADKAGNVEEAHKNFRQYLNKVQMSTSILLPSNMEDKLARGIDVSAKIELLTTEKGSLLLVDGSTIVVTPAKTYGRKTFDIDAAFGEDEEQTEKPAKNASKTVKETLKPSGGKKTPPKAKA